jgi:hypothetical protein
VTAAAVGLAFVARSWWTILAGLVVLPLYGERVLDNDPLGLFFTVVFLTPAALALFAIATVIGKAVDPARARMAGIVTVSLAAALTAVGLYVDRRVVDESPDEPLVIDAERGTYRGLQIGLRKADARSLLGDPPERADVEGDETPVGVDYSDISAPSSYPAWDKWRYEGFAVFFAKGQVQGFVTTSDRSETREGVGVGDSLDLVEDRYTGVTCDALTAYESSIPETPYCTGGIADDRQIWFGGDPIDSIWVYRDFSLALPERIAAR